MYRIILLFIVFNLSFGNLANSQTLSLALEAYENLQYDIALNSFEKVWKKQKGDTEVNYMYGKCILRADVDRTSAIPHLETVIGNDVNYKDACLELAKAYTYAHEFDKAQKMISFFQKNYDFEADEENGKRKEKEAKVILSQIEVAKKLMAKPLNVSFHNLGENVNSKRSEFNPSITQDGQHLYYTSNNKYDSDLLELVKNGFFVDFTPDMEHHWTKMKSLGKNVNSTENEMIVGLSKDDKKLIMSVNWMDDKGDLFITSKEKKKFQELSELEKTVNSEFDEPSGSLSINEDTLFFSSNRPGGFGGLDLYISVKLPDGTWGKPLNLGPSINTEYNETFPNIDRAGNFLYFSSDRPESMGGYDIFTAEYKNKQWTDVKNFGYPINDFYDNKTISFSRSMRYAYISKIDNDNHGGFDICQVIFNDIPAQNIIYTGTIKKGDAQKSDIIKEAIKIEAYEMQTNKLFAKSMYSESGKYTFAFPPGQFKIKISGSSFNTYEKIIRIPENEPQNTFITYNILVN